ASTMPPRPGSRPGYRSQTTPGVFEDRFEQLHRTGTPVVAVHEVHLGGVPVTRLERLEHRHHGVTHHRPTVLGAHRVEVTVHRPPLTSSSRIIRTRSRSATTLPLT